MSRLLAVGLGIVLLVGCAGESDSPSRPRITSPTGSQVTPCTLGQSFDDPPVDCGGTFRDVGPVPDDLSEECVEILMDGGTVADCPPNAEPTTR